EEFTVRNPLGRVGERYRVTVGGDFAETKFRVLARQEQYYLLAAEPLTGRTHQIRVHCESKGCPILADTLYGGDPFPRMRLHAAELTFRLPGSGQLYTARIEPTFFQPPWLELRRLVIDQRSTGAFRLMHGGSDGASFYLECWGDNFLVQS